MVELRVEAVAVDYRGSPVVVLREKGGSRAVFIWVGIVEATAISMHLEKQEAARPMTHDLIVSLLQSLGAGVDQVVLTDVREDTYYADLYLTSGDQTRAIDCRPSDAIAVALRVQAPIYIDSELLNRLDEYRHEREEAISSESTFVDSGETTIH
jgi:hypothetical protein